MRRHVKDIAAAIDERHFDPGRPRAARHAACETFGHSSARHDRELPPPVYRGLCKRQSYGLAQALPQTRRLPGMPGVDDYTFALGDDAEALPFRNHVAAARTGVHHNCRPIRRRIGATIGCLAERRFIVKRRLPSQP